MKQLLNTLYITNPDCYLGREGKTVVISNESKKLGQFPIHNFEDIICFNYTGVSPALLELCSENEVNISYLNRNGKFIGKYYGQVKGNVLLRKEQYRISEDKERSLVLSKLFIYAKVYNQKNAIDRHIRDHSNKINSSTLISASEKLRGSKGVILNVNSNETLLGIEGDASREYFKCINSFIQDDNTEFTFNGRNRRPPLDPVNAMLSLCYGLLRVKVESGLNSVGLDPYVGFFHRDRPGRPSLALDLMEELRVYLADRMVISLINRCQVSKKDFLTKENGAVLFTEEGFKKFIDIWNKRLQEEIRHPFLEETIEIGLLPYVQALLLARYIRGDIDMYPPFFQN